MADLLRIDRRFGLFASLLLLVGVAAADIAIGPEIDLRLLYLAPMLLATFSGGAAPGLLMAAGVSGALLGGSLLNGHLFSSDALHYLDVLTRLARDAIVVLIAAALRGAYLREKAMASRDGLTGLLSHHAFREAADSARQRLVASGRPLVVCHLDIDRFRAFNADHGYGAGDRLLRDFARALVERMPSGATVGRLASDEFGVLLPDVAMAEAIERMTALKAALRERLPSVTFCAGIAVWVQMPPQVDSLLRSAASQMHSARALGPDTMRSAEYAPGFRTIAEALEKVA